MTVSERSAALQAQLRRVLDTTYARWGANELSIVGAGLESVVFHATTAAFGDVVFRVPWARWVNNDNDPSLDARDLLVKEQLLSNHMAANGVPSPRALARHEGADDFDFLVSTFLPNDQSAVDPRAFGQLVRSIHAAPRCVQAPVRHEALAGLASAATVSGPSLPEALPEMLSERMGQRAAVIERIAGMGLGLPPTDELLRQLRSASGRQSILHMDARPENLLTSGGEIVGIVDWSNALFGDPALELARILEYGQGAEFLAGYGSGGALPAVTPELELVYRLDTAIMLAVVFFSEAPDPIRARQQLSRVQELLEALRVQSGQRSRRLGKAAGVAARLDVAPCSLYASPEWLAVQAAGGREPSQVITAPDSAGRARCLLPLHAVSPTRNPRYAIAHLLRGVPLSSSPTSVVLCGSLSGYQTEVASARNAEQLEVLAAALAEVRQAAPDSVVVLPYVTHQLAVALTQLDPTALPLLEAADAWLINPAASVEELRQSWPARVRHVVDADERRFAASGLTATVLPLRENAAGFATLVAQHASRHGAREDVAGLTAHLQLIADQFGDAALLLAALHRGRLVAATLGLIYGQYLYLRMVGNEHAAVEGSAAHFVLSFYNSLRLCSERGLRGVHLGLNIDRTKRARGATLEPLWTVLLGAALEPTARATVAGQRSAELTAVDPGGAELWRRRLTADGSAPR